MMPWGEVRMPPMYEGVVANTDVRTTYDSELDDRDRETGDWFCLRIKSWRCVGCQREITFSDETRQHAVIVWPSDDDPNLLTSFERHARHGRWPEIRPYERALGPAISFYEWQRLSDEGEASE